MRDSGASPPIFRTAALAVCAAILCACAGAPLLGDGRGGTVLLRDNLAVAEAALAAGQPAAARRLYSSLAERFEESPEPRLGLGYISFDAGEFAAGEKFFVEAAERAGDTPAIRAEALLGAARTALAAGRTDAARTHFGEARQAGDDLPSAAWAANGLAVIATIDGDFEAAEARYAEALRLSSGHPRISANFLRMLIAAGMTDSAADIYARHDPSYWLDGDGAALSRLIDDSRRQGHAGARARSPASPLVMRLSASGADAVRVERFDPPASSALVLRIGDATVASAAPDADDAPGKPPRAKGSRPVPRAGKPARRSSRKAPKVLTLALGHSRRLWLRGDATGVLVAAPEVADVQLLSPKVLYIIGKSVGRTTVAVLGEDERVRDWILSVVLDIEPLREILATEPELSGVRARRAARGVALTGEVASAALSERALRLAAGALPKDTPVENGLRVTGAQQVNLEVQIAEVQRSVSEDIGINWEAFRIRGDDLLGFRIGRFVPVLGTQPGGADLRTSFDGEVSPGLSFGREFGPESARTRVAGMIDALARAGLANVLARPNVTAVSGESASLFSGGEFPLPTGFDDGVIVFEYKKYGILLDFVPTVIDTGRIVLKVRPEVSEPSLNQAVQVVGVDVPVINVRRAETTVEVGDGDSIVIAGLFRNASNTREAGVPGLKDIPGLGTLFGHRSVRSEELELIVIVTARLVSAGSFTAGAEAPPSPRVSGYHF